MEQDLRDRIRAATEESGITRPDFIALLKLIDQHYDRMEATITQSLQSQTLTPLEAIFDSVTEALLSVGEDGIVRKCNKVRITSYNVCYTKLLRALRISPTSRPSKSVTK